MAQQKSSMERLIDRTYSIIEGDSAAPRKRYFFVLPIWGIAPETGIRLGVSVGYLFRVKHTDSITRPSLLRLNTQYTQNGQFSVRPTIDIFFAENKYNLKAQFIYNNFNENYWGIGNKVSENAKENYKFRLNKLNLKLTKQFIKNLYAGLQLQYERLYDIRFNDSSNAPSGGVAGINGYNILGGGIAIAYDNRDHVYYPFKGAYIELSNLSYPQAFGGNHQFHNITFDARKYHRLWKENVLALQLFGNFNFGNVPYRQMGTIGNDMIMRGYYNGRFRDQHLLAFQLELRKIIWGPLGIVVFGGGGNVGRDVPDLLSTIKANYGVGVRFLGIRKEHLNIRTDLGFGQNGIYGFYFTMGEAF
ncbi:MAG: BamA/TamA family outer membrane protein [Bacteroidia bacterium]|nr:BamA/TamA family outer membrane protein [Bacteroidia bacterium]